MMVSLDIGMKWNRLSNKSQINSKTFTINLNNVMREELHFTMNAKEEELENAMKTFLSTVNAQIKEFICLMILSFT